MTHVASASLRGAGIAVLLIAAMTLALLSLDRWIELASYSVLYLIPVIATATRWGMLPAVVAAIGGVAASAFLFYPPIYSLRVFSAQQVVDLCLFLLVAVVTSRLATGLKRQTAIARRRDEEARLRAETDLLREALIGSVSHELRTPLSSIMGAATVLRQAPAVAADQRLATLAAVLREEAERLNDDIQNLLDATRISREGVRPRPDWVEPADIVNSALKRRARQLAGHDVSVDMESDLPLVHADAVLVEQALVQILDNAAKYSPAGAPIAVSARRSDGAVTLSVTDRGRGFAADELAHVGERFFRGARHRSGVPGTGLGLWIARAFARANGGDIAVASVGEGGGAVVSLSLPMTTDVPAAEGGDDDG